jgi:hypothetical protein
MVPQAARPPPGVLPLAEASAPLGSPTQATLLGNHDRSARDCARPGTVATTRSSTAGTGGPPSRNRHRMKNRGGPGNARSPGLPCGAWLSRGEVCKHRSTAGQKKITEGQSQCAHRHARSWGSSNRSLWDPWSTFPTVYRRSVKTISRRLVSPKFMPRATVSGRRAISRPVASLIECWSVHAELKIPFPVSRLIMSCRYRKPGAACTLIDEPVDAQIEA